MVTSVLLAKGGYTRLLLIGGLGILLFSKFVMIYLLRLSV